MYEHIRSIFGENPWLLALVTIAFFTIKGLLWIAVPVIAIRWKRWLLGSGPLAIRKP